MPRMRTAEGVLKIILEQDPESAVTLRFIRRIISEGRVPVCLVGRKKLVDADEVIRYITTGNVRPDTTTLTKINK